MKIKHLVKELTIDMIMTIAKDSFECSTSVAGNDQNSYENATDDKIKQINEYSNTKLET